MVIYPQKGLLENTLLTGRQRGQVVRALDLKSCGPGFKSCSDGELDLFLGSPKFNSSAGLVNSQLVCLLPARILTKLISI